MATAEPFVWGDGGTRMTPEEIARRREMAAALIAQGADFSPVVNPWQGIARLGQGWLGGRLAGLANEREGELNRYNEDLIASLLGQGGDGAEPVNPGAIFADPSATPVTRELAMSLLRSQMEGTEWDRRFGMQNQAEDSRFQRQLDAQRDLAMFKAAIGRDTAKDQQVARLMETGLDRNTAIAIADGRLVTSRDPITQQAVVLDKATGQPYMGGGIGAQPAMPEQDAGVPPAIAGQWNPSQSQFPATAAETFGLQGTIAGGINMLTDTAGLGPAFPEVQQTQADFNVLRESIMNDLSAAYDRPPTWLLKEIRSLTPSAGNPLEGPGSAKSKLEALHRNFASELDATERSLTRTLSPTNRQELEARQAGLIQSMSRIERALTAFPAAQGGQPPLPTGEADEDGWTTLPNGVRIREVR